MSAKKILCFLKGYEEFKVHKNSNCYNSGPEVDIDSLSTLNFIVHRGPHKA